MSDQEGEKQIKTQASEDNVEMTPEQFMIAQLHEKEDLISVSIEELNAQKLEQANQIRELQKQVRQLTNTELKNKKQLGHLLGENNILRQAARKGPERPAS